MARRRHFRSRHSKPTEQLILLIILGAFSYAVFEQLRTILSIKAVVNTILIIPLAAFSATALGALAYVAYHHFLIYRIKSERSDRLLRERTLGDIRRMTPNDFEHYVAALFEKQGYKAEVTQQSDDKGIDVVLSKDKKTIAVQAKLYSDNNIITPDQVRDFRGSYASRHDGGIFVTTSDFTAKARKWALEEGVQLINGNDLVEIARETMADY